jgi:hypothetical protein
VVNGLISPAVALHSPLSTLTLFGAVLAALTLSLSAQKIATPAAEAPEPWILGTIGVGKGANLKTPKTTAQKGIAIKIGEEGEAAVAYDLDSCRILGAWTGNFTTPIDSTARGEYPIAMGEVAFTTGETTGFVPSDKAQPQGQARFKAFYVNDGKTILKWDVGGTEVLEMPDYNMVLNGGGYFTRTFLAAPSRQAVTILVASDPQADNPFDVPTHRRAEGVVPGLEDKERIMQSTPWVHGEHGEVMIWAAGDPEGSMWRKLNGQLALEVAAHEKPVTFQIAYWTAPANDPDGRGAPLFFREPEIDLPALLRNGTAHLPEGVSEAAKN